MNRVEIKQAAKAKIKGNIWNLLWPLLVIWVLQSVLNRIFGGAQTNALLNVDLNNFDINTLFENIKVSPIVTLITFIFAIIEVCYLKYVLNFIRTGNFEFKDILNCLKEKWLNILLVTLISRVLISIGIAFFIIPGIILALGWSMASVVVIDSDLSAIDALKKSWNMMKGYKWNYLIFILSFLGWALLAPFTLGLLFIWLIPYITVAELMYYEKLKEVKKD